MFNDKYKKAVEQDCAIIRLDLGGGVCVYIHNVDVNYLALFIVKDIMTQ